MAISSEALSDTVKRFSPDTPNVERIRYSGGATNATGELEGQVVARLAFKALVTRGRTGLVIRGYGELPKGSISALADARQFADAYSDVVVGEILIWKGGEYEVTEAQTPDLYEVAPFVRFRAKEVQNHGRG